MRALIPLLLLVLAAPHALAQNSASNAAQSASTEREQLQNKEQNSSRTHQRTERIRVEDGGSRIDELRVGGQTQNITVQPKVGSLPEYEVQSSDGVRNRSRNGAEATTGARVWNIKKF